jgi:hypothetical protein
LWYLLHLCHSWLLSDWISKLIHHSLLLSHDWISKLIHHSWLPYHHRLSHHHRLLLHHNRLLLHHNRLLLHLCLRSSLLISLSLLVWLQRTLFFRFSEEEEPDNKCCATKEANSDHNTYDCNNLTYHIHGFIFFISIFFTLVTIMFIRCGIICSSIVYNRWAKYS